MSCRFPGFTGPLFRLSCWFLIGVTPASLLAADPGTAMLYGKGVVLRNGVEIPNSSAIFSGDLLETKDGSIANINTSGSSLVILPGSLVEFEGKTLSVEHGSVTVATSRGIGVRVGCTTVSPTTSSWTQFAVTDVNGTVQIAAEKNEISIGSENSEQTSTSQSSASTTSSPSTQSAPTTQAPSSDTSLHPGEQATRDEADGCKKEKHKKKRAAGAGAPTASTQGPLATKYALYGGIAAGGGLALWLALQSSMPPSPWKP